MGVFKKNATPIPLGLFKYYDNPPQKLLRSLLTGLIANRAGSLARRLAGGLALAAAAFPDGIL